MEPAPLPEYLTLFDALVRWGNPVLLDALREVECSHIAMELMIYPEPKLTSQADWRKPSSDDWLRGSTTFLRLDVAWSALKRDFQAMIAKGSLFLEAVEVTKTYDAEPQALREAFASEYKFDFSRNTLTFNKRRFVSVTVSRSPSPWAAIETRTASSLRPQRPDDVPALSDDTILALLEEHITRVVESPEPKMLGRIKHSLDPIILRRLEWRFNHGQMNPHVGEEATELRAWIMSVATWHQKLEPKTVENHIRKKWNELMTRSNAPISRSRG